MSGTPYFCPVCGEQDLRPDETDEHSWVCRACATVFSVTIRRSGR